MYDPSVFWEEVHKMLDDVGKKRDRYVSIYFNPGGAISVFVYPWPDDEYNEEIEEESDL